MRKLKADNAFAPFELTGAQGITTNTQNEPEELLSTSSNFCSFALKQNADFEGKKVKNRTK